MQRKAISSPVRPPDMDFALICERASFKGSSGEKEEEDVKAWHFRAVRNIWQLNFAADFSRQFSLLARRSGASSTFDCNFLPPLHTSNSTLKGDFPLHFRSSRRRILFFIPSAKARAVCGRATFVAIEILAEGRNANEGDQSPAKASLLRPQSQNASLVDPPSLPPKIRIAYEGISRGKTSFQKSLRLVGRAGKGKAKEK